MVKLYHSAAWQQLGHVADLGRRMVLKFHAAAGLWREEPKENTYYKCLRDYPTLPHRWASFEQGGTNGEHIEGLRFRVCLIQRG